MTQQEEATQEQEKATQEAERRRMQFMMEKEKQARETERKRQEHDEMEVEVQLVQSTKEMKIRFGRYDGRASESINKDEKRGRKRG